VQLASFEIQTNFGQGLKWETRCNDTMNVMGERKFMLAVSFSGLNDDPLDYRYLRCFPCDTPYVWMFY
jgi:hypothetical protein